MKKTFEELIEEKAKYNKWLKELTESEIQLIVDFGTEIREATIKECMQVAEEYGEYGTADYASDLPTNSIQVDEPTNPEL